MKTSNVLGLNFYDYGILDFARVHNGPVQVKGCVDDITQSQRGTDNEIIAALVPADSIFMDRPNDYGQVERRDSCGNGAFTGS